jgi:hypothetical protein
MKPAVNNFLRPSVAASLLNPNTQLHILVNGTAMAQWLRYCATNRKVAGSIPGGVIGMFHWHNPSDCTMALEVDSASNRNEYQEHFLGVKAAGAKGWQPYHHPVPLSCNLGTLTCWNPLGHSKPVTGLLYLFYYSVSHSLPNPAFIFGRPPVCSYNEVPLGFQFLPQGLNAGLARRMSASKLIQELLLTWS